MFVYLAVHFDIYLLNALTFCLFVCLAVGVLSFDFFLLMKTF